MEPSTTTKHSRSVIVNHLTVKLIAIGLFALVVNGLVSILSDPVSPLGTTLLLLGNVAVLWLFVDAVFTAFDDLLELKLEQRLEDEGRSS
ncbi:hypothetical protein [Natronobacterium texcoconense]|uniref:Uncharacterized protein n=1 Tax=Natronobacterium texcoconense TaxID=1095778 RepID=A0A1H0YZI5_NATTX|nr:hypothetical protein [Natronobacterium texcoconense]SDQ20605.1 hypothetical protein SAMN04489842_0073 [Natronobacterium texcoconense]